LTAIVVGSLLGGAMLAASLVLGARTGAPAMVLLRGLLGARASFVPTLLNIVQCLGWAVFELVVIGQALQGLVHLPRWACVLAAGAVTWGLTIRPLGAIRVLRRYVSVLVVAALMVLVVGLLRHPLRLPSGSWSGFWLAVDAAVALTISWVPLGADYSRHARSARSAFAGGFAGYGATQIACLSIGILALAQVGLNPNRIFDLFVSLPLGVVGFAVLVLRETDQSFANVYSTAVSIQNMAPRWDRRVLTTIIGAVSVAAALTLNISQYTNFLYLIGGVFIPLSGVLVGCWWRVGSGQWDTTAQAPVRPAMLLAWGVGFVVYQLINPGAIPHWSAMWQALGTDLRLAGHPWLSASIVSFAVALLLAAAGAGGRRRQPPAPDRTRTTSDHGERN
jgi:putative hydroxymethylpyrimidine transporter CytX